MQIDQDMSGSPRERQRFAPSVSVVIPTRHRHALLMRAIGSVLRQTVLPSEIIVVIDGEDPDTVEALADLAEPIVRFHVQPFSQGPGVARNVGVEMARGDWIAFLDDDDEWLPDRLAVQLPLMEREGPDALIFLSTQSRVDTAQGVFVRPTDAYDSRWPIDEWLFDRRSWFAGGQSFIQSSSFLAPRSLLLRAPFPPTRLHEDWELVIRAVKDHGCRLIMTDAAVVVHYLHFREGSLGAQADWKKSLAWADGVGPLLSRRAYSGFCLTVVSQGVTRARAYSAFWPLLRAAFTRGSPTARQLFAYAMLWLLPDGLRRRVRAMLQAQR